VAYRVTHHVLYCDNTQWMGNWISLLTNYASTVLYIIRILKLHQIVHPTEIWYTILVCHQIIVPTLYFRTTQWMHNWIHSWLIVQRWYTLHPDGKYRPTYYTQWKHLIINICTYGESSSYTLSSIDIVLSTKKMCSLYSLMELMQKKSFNYSFLIIAWTSCHDIFQ
jgi:hypothetical protein